MFRNRQDAALQLAAQLEKYRDQPLIVLGIPRGGIETAYYISHQLDAPLSVVIVRKLGYPRDPEFAFGAITEDGSVYYTAHLRKSISQETMDNVEDEQLKEIQRRVQLFRKGQPLPDLTNKTVIIADDGIATAATVIAAIRLCKKKGAAKVIVAAPVAALDKVKEIEMESAEAVIIQQLPVLYAVSESFEEFRDLTDNEALFFLEKREKEKLTEHH
ncbi:phosphoribosyltransferase [Pseudoflavitalea rhizosphaerae]|uniref:phosphoribosyltransferase n=1 Tax=Pseudoflavitalea rhizosphaerae TaxID=1884793 RepID=UPI000F8EC0AC|nr:phosphoribosyltransferase family protein [Pseudoflavitalea rhizosphaerae]